MKAHLQELVADALMDLERDGLIPSGSATEIKIERARNKDHGDYATNVAMVLAKAAGRRPRELAELVVEHLPESVHIERVEIAGPGFINFFVSQRALRSVVSDVLRQGEHYGCGEEGGDMPVTVEFVSANPTGPLHVGHGRGAAYGASLSNILAARGYAVQREYYVNDAGRQMDILGASVWLRYLELAGEPVRFPDNGYRGDYVYDIARALRAQQGDALRCSEAEVTRELPPDAADGGDKEAHIDALIARARELLGDTAFTGCVRTALDAILDDIRDDLAALGVTYDRWFAESELVESGAIDRAIRRLREAGYLYESEGATWFGASQLGDDKDRVVIRDNGQATYFASDIAYFLNKRERGFERAFYILGADHHGYVPRLKAAAAGLGEDPDKMEIRLVQFAVLYRGGEKVPMSTRAGQFVTLRELHEEVGTDAARFFYVMRAAEQHLDFDLDLAKSQTQDNPVYYIQYAHARIVSVFRQLVEKGLSYNRDAGEAALARLDNDHEEALLTALDQYPETVEAAAAKRAPHTVAHYLRDLANHFHSYYNAHPFIVDDADLRNARLALCHAVQIVIVNGLGLLGVTAPESM